MADVDAVGQFAPGDTHSDTWLIDAGRECCHGMMVNMCRTEKQTCPLITLAEIDSIFQVSPGSLQSMSVVLVLPGAAHSSELSNHHRVKASLRSFVQNVSHITTYGSN